MFIETPSPPPTVPASSARARRAAPIEPPARLAVFGGSGGVGRALLEQALGAGYAVRVLARDAARITAKHPRLEVVEGDVLDRAAVETAVRGCDAVFCGLGAPALSASRVRSEGTRRIAEAMRAEGLKRIVAISVLGAHETRRHLPFALRYLVFPTYLRRAGREHERQEDVLAASSLDWTVLRPPHLTDGPLTAAYRHGFGTDFAGISFYISRADVAHHALEVLRTGEALHRRVGLSDPSAG